MYSSGSKNKSAIVERANRVWKSKLVKMQENFKTQRWVDMLQDIATSFNSSYNRIIKMSPFEAENNTTLAFINSNKATDLNSYSTQNPLFKKAIT